MPRMDEFINSLREAALFVTLDVNSYWQVEMVETNRDKTALTSHHGLYHFVQMPFGLNDAPKTFQHAMDIILPPVKWQFALVSLDNIIVFSRSPCDHIEHEKRVVTPSRCWGYPEGNKM